MSRKLIFVWLAATLALSSCDELLAVLNGKILTSQNSDHLYLNIVPANGSIEMLDRAAFWVLRVTQKGNPNWSYSLPPEYIHKGGYTIEGDEFDIGLYKLLACYLIDVNGKIIYAVPVAGSPKASLVKHPISTTFLDLQSGDEATMTPEFLSTEGAEAADFGYEALGLPDAFPGRETAPAEPKLVLWNKLEEVVNGAIPSEIGPSGFVEAGLVFGPGKAGNGIRPVDFDAAAPFSGSAANRRASFPKSVVPGKAGSVEFWFTPAYDSPQGHNTAWVFVDNDGNSGISLIWIGNYAGINNRIDLTIGQNGVGTKLSVLSPPLLSPGQPAHFAIVWDADGISAGTDTMRIYVNGVPIGSTGQSLNRTSNANDSFDLKILNTPAPSWGGDWYAQGTMDELKIWDGAKTDWPLISNSATLLLWNKLESTASEVGPGLSEGSAGSVTWGLTAKHGNGATLNGKPGLVLSATKVADLGLSAEEGTIEFWFQQTEVPKAYSYGLYRFVNGPWSSYGSDGEWWNTVGVFALDPTELDAPWLTAVVSFDKNPATAGVEPVKLTFDPYPGTRNGTGWDSASELSWPVLNNTPHHLALVWKRSGIAGTAETARLYFNGAPVASSTATNWGTTVSGVLDICSGQDASFHGKMWMDNLKVHRTAKTDFSDRFNESGY